MHPDRAKPYQDEVAGPLGKSEGIQFESYRGHLLLPNCGGCFYNRGNSEEEKEPNPLFRLGQIVGTPGALDALIESKQNLAELLVQHVTGNWVDLDDEDKKENELSVKEGF